MVRKIVTLGLICACLAAVSPGDAKELIKPTARAVEHNNRGALLLDQNRLTEAEYELKTAIQLSPQYAEAYNNLGIIYEKRKQYDQAMTYFEKAAGLNKNYPAPRSHIASVHIARGQYDQAIKVLKKTLKKAPNFTEGVYNLGLAYLLKARETVDPEKKKKLYQQAERELQEATQLNSKFVEAHLNLADLYVETGRLTDAEIRYRLALEDHPGAAHAYEQLAHVLELQGKNAEAKALLTKGREVQRDLDAKTSFDAGYQLMEEGEQQQAAGKQKIAQASFSRAVQAFAQALQHKPTYPEAAYGLGLANQRLGKTDAARNAWEKTLKQMPNHPGALFNLGTLSFQQGRVSEGLVYYCDFLRVSGRGFPAQTQIVQNLLREQQLTCPK